MEDSEILPGYKNINDFSKKFLGSVVAMTKTTNELPDVEDDYSNPSYDTYRQIMSTMGQRILSLTENILHYHGIGGGIFSGDEGMDVDDRFNILVDANIELCERVETRLDEASGIKKDDISLVVVSRTPKQMTPGLKLSKNVMSASRDTTCSLLTAKNITKPQLMFREKVDNSSRPFVPKIKHKPNALKSLEESMQTVLPDDYESNPSFSFPHPYQFELENFMPDQRLLEQVVSQVPPSLDETPLTIVETIEDLVKLNEHLKTVDEFAVDLEHHFFRSYQGFTCLMQISTRKEDYIVDTLLLRDELHLLNEVFTDPKILKVLHGANSDIDWLQKDFGIYVVNMFDSGQAARLLSLQRFSLAYLLKHYCNVDADKQYQLADWRVRPLMGAMLKYAREDTHYLLYIYDCMKNDLLHRDNGQTSLLLSAFQKSNHLCMKKYEKPRFTEESYKEFYQHELNKRLDGRKTSLTEEFNSRQMEALKSLYTWRDQMAREHDESNGYVLPNHMMLQICKILPKEPEGIIALCHPLPVLVQGHVDEIHRMIQKARQKPLVEAETVRPQLKPTRLQHPRYQANSLLDCPHDLSHQSEAQNQTDSTQTIGESDSKMDVDSVVAAVQEKEEPDISVFNGAAKVARSKRAKKRLEAVISSMTDSFDKYLPTSILSKKYVNGLASMQDQSVWRLLPNTSNPQPVPNQSKPVLQAEMITESTLEKIPEVRSLRDQINSERKRAQETMESPVMAPLRKKEKRDKKHSPESDANFTPYDYGSLAIDKLLGDARALVESASSSRKKKRDYDPNFELQSSGFKNAPKPRTNPAHGNKTMTYSTKGGSNGGMPRIQWPKK